NRVRISPPYTHRIDESQQEIRERAGDASYAGHHPHDAADELTFREFPVIPVKGNIDHVAAVAHDGLAQVYVVVAINEDGDRIAWADPLMLCIDEHSVSRMDFALPSNDWLGAHLVGPYNERDTLRRQIARIGNLKLRSPRDR